MAIWIVIAAAGGLAAGFVLGCLLVTVALEDRLAPETERLSYGRGVPKDEGPEVWRMVYADPDPSERWFRDSCGGIAQRAEEWRRLQEEIEADLREAADDQLTL